MNTLASMSAIRFDILAQSSDTNARSGVIQTPHGQFETPAFMPVGTRATVKGLTPQQAKDTDTGIILNNTYHLMLRPGSKLIQSMGGVHQFMKWNGPILTDSGGYQVFSMSDINKINEDGVIFKSIIDGSEINLTPERSIEIQNELGADIIMAFDDCPPSTDPINFAQKQRNKTKNTKNNTCFPQTLLSEKEYTQRLDIANERTIRWLERCVKAHQRLTDQALFGIVQGGTDLDRRSHSVEQVCGIDLPGYAIGGVAVGEGTEQIQRVVEHTAPLLPKEKPRYLMGVGYEWDIVMAVRAGVDMFDCVLPTRNGRNGNAFTKKGQIRLKNTQYREDERVIELDCDCPTCTEGFSRAYLRHLFAAGEMLGPILLSLHNIRHFQRLMVDIRWVIVEDRWPELYSDWPVLRAGKSAEASG